MELLGNPCNLKFKVHVIHEGRLCSQTQCTAYTCYWIADDKGAAWSMDTPNMVYMWLHDCLFMMGTIRPLKGWLWELSAATTHAKRWKANKSTPAMCWFEPLQQSDPEPLAGVECILPPCPGRETQNNFKWYLAASNPVYVPTEDAEGVIVAEGIVKRNVSFGEKGSAFLP